MLVYCRLTASLPHRFLPVSLTLSYLGGPMGCHCAVMTTTSDQQIISNMQCEWVLILTVITVFFLLTFHTLMSVFLKCGALQFFHLHV